MRCSLRSLFAAWMLLGWTVVRAGDTFAPPPVLPIQNAMPAIDPIVPPVLADSVPVTYTNLDENFHFTAHEQLVSDPTPDGTPAPEAGSATEAEAVPETIMQPQPAPVYSPSCLSQFMRPCAHTGLMGGVSLYFLKPYATQNQAYTVQSTVAPFSVQTVNFDPSYSTSPAMWLGWQGANGLGARVRGFYYYHNLNTLTPTTAGGGFPAVPSVYVGGTFQSGLPFAGNAPLSQTNIAGAPLGDTNRFYFNNRLFVNSIDFEGTFDWASGPFTFLATSGVRYQHLSSNYVAADVFTTGANVAVGANLVSYNRNFNGAGPTASLQAYRRLGSTRLKAFGIVRGSYVAGQSKETTYTAMNVGTLQNSSYTSTNNNAIPVGDIELGLEYGQPYGGRYFFFRAAGVDQTYFGAGSATSAQGNLSLFGGQISGGINY